MKDKRYFLCPSCNKKMTCDIFDKGDSIDVILKCTNGLCGAKSRIVFTNTGKIVNTWCPIKNATDKEKKKAIYSIVGGHLKDLRKKIKHSDFREEELWPNDKIDGQISIFDKE